MDRENLPKRGLRLTTTLKVRVPQSRAKFFQRVARQREINVSVVVREALLDYVRRHEERRQPEVAPIGENPQ